ncbi:ATP-binding protein [Nodularia sp. UHCC 0506]|uniref:ATP-binding protein n=1 Tax=Nodularia sp. UHCC 0506 TaxID=3110243 RepID=UPI002B213C21|nr:ATP-binding protein [Nodularia sp. UHCC 0506]MEA5514863.1 ATP-binding protein [Nodularia sp. UHCC 0506]
MPKKKKTEDSKYQQLEMEFPVLDSKNIKIPNKDVLQKLNIEEENPSTTDTLQSYFTNTTQSTQDRTNDDLLESNPEKSDNLFLPFSYEDIIDEIGEKKSRLPDLIVPVTKFEKEIVKVLSNIINSSGKLLFLYGASGVGKSTFISSLQFQPGIPVKEIVSIKANELLEENKSISKFDELIQQIQNKANTFFAENTKNGEKLCIVIEHLERLKEKDKDEAISFFTDLNGWLRKYPILIIWPVTVYKDLENMQNWAKNYSSTMFYRKIPFINFTGPPIEEYPNIAKKTIMFFNQGKSCHEFQLNDNDFETLRKEYENKPPEKQLIREYLLDVKEIWNDRTKYIEKIENSIPKPTEVWFIFAYPEAEGVVARFAKQMPENINEMWNAEYNPLQPYINEHTQRSADWPAKRLTLALNSRMLTTKIMYLPTNALISCIVAYANDAKIKISREDFKDENKYKVPDHWFGKQLANDTLKRTPLYLQLSGGKTPTGKRKSGTVEKALNNARKAFEKINEDISASKSGKIGDKPFNKAICLALESTLSELNFQFRCEQYHPHLRMKPDITVETPNKIICLEFCYTIDNTPGNLADYVLSKLNKYMKQLEQVYRIPEDLNW